MSLGSILATAAPIAVGAMVPGGGFAAIMAGAATGAGIAALSGGDILSGGVMGGIGGYGGAELGAAFNPGASSGIAAATGTTNAAVNQAAMSNMTGSALGQGGFNTAAGRGLMGVATPGMAGVAGASANTGLQNVTAQNTGQGFSPYATPDTLGSSATQFSTDAAYNAANPNLGIDVSDVVRDRITGQVAGPNLGTGTDPSNFFGDASSYTGAQTPDFANIVKSTPQELAANQARQAVDTSFSAGLERLGDGSTSKGAMKLGLTSLPLIAAAAYEEPLTYDQMKEAEAYDPYETLNLDDPALDSGIEDVINEDSGLRLYANQGGMVPTYAEGGTIESRADQGMRDALARNQGTAYAQPTTAYTPTTAPSNNIKIAGADNSTSNIGRGVGALNVGSGSIGQSANAIKAAQVAAEAEEARITKIKNTPRQYRLVGTGIMGGTKYVPVGWNGIGSYNDPYGMTQRAGAAEAKARGGYAEGGTIESRAKEGMAGALARNKGTAYAQPTTNASSNVNIAGADNSTSNIGRGVGSLNVNSGTIGQSPNAVAEAARLKAIEDAKPKMKMLRGYEVPIDYVPGNDAVMGMGTAQSHYYDRDAEEWIKGQRPSNPFTYGVGSGGIGNQFSWLTGGGENPYYAEGGAVKGYAQGGMLEGPGDGMSDSLAAQIDGSQPAALSQGEFVVPADVVSHLGNGSSDAGSKRLYAMMDEVRQARTGTEKQGKEINPERYMPA